MAQGGETTEATTPVSRFHSVADGFESFPRRFFDFLRPIAEFHAQLWVARLQSSESLWKHSRRDKESNIFLLIDEVFYSLWGFYDTKTWMLTRWSAVFGWVLVELTFDKKKHAIWRWNWKVWLAEWWSAWVKQTGIHWLVRWFHLQLMIRVSNSFPSSDGKHLQPNENLTSHRSESHDFALPQQSCHRIARSTRTFQH